MNKDQAIKKIKIILGMEAPEVAPVVETPVKLGENTLQDGTMISYDNLETGSPIFIVAEDGTKIPAPVGEYITSDAITITVVAEGVIETVTKPSEETVPPVEPVLAAEEKPEPPAEEEQTPTTEECIAELRATVDAQGQRLVEIETVLAELVANFGSFNGDFKDLKEKVTSIAKAPSELPVFAKSEDPKPENFTRVDNLNLLKKQLQ